MPMLPPTTYEQRAYLYSDVKEMITLGFLSHKCRLGGSTIAIRNLNNSDSIFIRHCIYDNNDLEWMMWAVSRSIWMIDGLVLLGEKNSAYVVRQQITHLSKDLIERVFKLVLSLTRKANEQADKIEAFCFEDSSRSLWAQCKHLSLPSDRLSGIQGVETLGINLIQRIWISLNTFRDTIIDERKEWANAKFIASAHSPKGVDKINKKEQSALEQEENRKKRYLDEFYYRQTGVLKDEEDDGKLKNTLVKSASTPDELEDEMRRWVAGEQDEHDLIVLDYKNRIKENQQKELLERQQRLADVQKELEDEGEETITLSPLIGYTNEQLKELLVQKGRSPDGRKVSKVMYQDQSINLYNKHIDQQAGTGKLKVKDGKIVIKGEDNSLMEDIAKRSLKGGVKDNE